LLFCGFVDQTALWTLALDPGDARSHSIADLTAPEIPDNDPGVGSFGDDGLFQRSERMRALEALVLRVAGTDDPVLIQGEAGTGKTLVAKATHDLSGRWPGRLAANVRILATATRPFSAMSALSVDLHHLEVPPLRERREEIPSLVEHFRNGFASQLGRSAPRLSPELTRVLTDYDWPGNVRELENLVKRWVVLGDDAVRNELASRTQVRDAGGWVKDRPTQGVGLREIGRRAAQAAEQTALRDALARVGGHRAAAARLLQVSYRTLLQKLSADEHGSRSGARSRTAAGDAGPQPGDGALA
jgi:DNA-binding NtrC family response regulator